MTSNPNNQDQTLARRQGIAQLVQRGELKHENPGLYVEGDMTPEEKARTPSYSAAEVQAAFPDLLQINFDEDVDDAGNSHGFYAVLLDGRGPDQKIELGTNPPATTPELIEVIRAYYSKQFNVDALEKGREMFEGLDE